VRRQVQAQALNIKVINNLLHIIDLFVGTCHVVREEQTFHSILGREGGEL
jgi:hemerythrin-like domain-containing protein